VSAVADTGGEVRKSKILLDEEQVGRTLARMTHEIAEQSPDLANLALVGIQRRGVELAARLAGLLESFYSVRPPTGAIDITFYRDDIDTRSGKNVEQPRVHSTDIRFDINDKTIVLVDDVLYTGRTIRAAIDALFDYGRPTAVRLAVLVDRGHRDLPIRPDFVGKNVPTSRNEDVVVRLVEMDGVDEVAIAGAALAPPDGAPFPRPGSPPAVGSRLATPSRGGHRWSLRGTRRGTISWQIRL
jgi:pyrimidine operon attenuation protein/uracil phosphoribosyltransferase